MRAMVAVGSQTITQPAVTKPRGKKLFSFGVISDIQYADIPDGKSFFGVPRFYRNSVVALRRAVDSWQQEGVDFAIHFGDILDGFQPKDESHKALITVLDCFKPLQRRVYHMLGNHCLYNLNRPTLNNRLEIPEHPDGSSFYSFCPDSQHRFIVLDPYDVSMLGWEEGHPKHEEAKSILAANNPNQDWNSPEGQKGVARRFVKFGGGASRQQLLWLEEELKTAEAEGQAVIVSGHLPLFPGTCPPACLLWNFQEVLDLLWAAPPGLVVATLAGHTHQNGYLVDGHGIHHLVLPSLLETPPGRDAYGRIDVHTDTLVLTGTDCMMSVVAEIRRIQPQL